MGSAPEGWLGVDLGASVTSVSPPPPSFPSRPPPSSLVPQLRARDPASRGDRYMLVTYDEPPYCIKVKGPSRGWGGRRPGARRRGQLNPSPPPGMVLRRPQGVRRGGRERRGGRAERCSGGFPAAAAPGPGGGRGRGGPGAHPLEGRAGGGDGAAALEDGGHFAFV